MTFVNALDALLPDLPPEEEWFPAAVGDWEKTLPGETEFTKWIRVQSKRLAIGDRNFEDLPENEGFTPRVRVGAHGWKHYLHRYARTDLSHRDMHPTEFDAFRVPGFPDVAVRLTWGERPGKFEFEVIHPKTLRQHDRRASDFPFRILKMYRREAEFRAKLARCQLKFTS